MKIAKFIGNALETIRQFPPEAKRLAGHAIDNVQQGEMPDDWKPMATVGSGVYIEAGRRAYQQALEEQKK